MITAAKKTKSNPPTFTAIVRREGIDIWESKDTFDNETDAHSHAVKAGVILEEFIEQQEARS